MYSFLYSEAWWMETLITAMITAAGTITAAIIGCLAVVRKLTNMVERLPEEYRGLSGEHKGLSEEHRSLSEEHRDLAIRLEKTGDKMNEVNRLLSTEFAVSAERRAALRGKEQEIDRAISQLSDFNRLMQELRTRNESLVQENSQLRQENRQLKQALYRNRGRYQDPEP